MNKPKIHISKRLKRVLDQLESVLIFDNKNCEKSQIDKRIQENEKKIDDVPTA